MGCTGPRRSKTMELKNTYSSREVAAMTGLTARQLQWWDAKRLFASHIASKRTDRGGYTERRYTPVDLLELLVLADLRRQGRTVAELRRLLTTLRDQFRVRLFETIGGGGPLTLLTDGVDIYGRTAEGDALQSAARSTAADADDHRGRRTCASSARGRHGTQAKRPRRRAAAACRVRRDSKTVDCRPWPAQRLPPEAAEIAASIALHGVGGACRPKMRSTSR